MRFSEFFCYDAILVDGQRGGFSNRGRGRGQDRKVESKAGAPASSGGAKTGDRREKGGRRGGKVENAGRGASNRSD